MNRILLAVLVMTYSLLATKKLSGQVSYPSGFYSVDSLYFTVGWAKTSSQKLMISVNGFTEQAFHEYTGGVWLYNRNFTPNTWEDQVFSRNPCSYYFDTLVPRGSLKKVNVIRVRLIDTITAQVKKDSVYNIGIEGIGNTEFPFTVPVSFITVDSLDAFGPAGFYGPGDGDGTGTVWNYSFDKYGKRANLQVINPETNFRTDQFGEIRIGAGSSSCIANKGISFKGNNDAPFLGPKTITSDIYNGTPTKYKWMKFRVGGSGQRDVFATHEVGLKIIDGLKIGEVPSTPAITFFNGSYWSLAFPQDKPNQYAVERYTGINKDSVDIFEPIPLDIVYDSIVVYHDSSFVYNDGIVLFSFPVTALDTESVIIIDRLDGKHQIIAGVDEGTKKIAEPVFQKLFALDSVGDHFATIDSLIDLDSWLRYIALIDLLGLRDVITNNVVIATTPRNKPMILMEDLDGMGVWTGTHEDLWKHEIVDADEGYAGMMLHIIRNVLLKSPKTIERMLLVWQDLYNTALLPSRTVPLVESVKQKIMPEYGRFHNSWDPNATRDSLSQEDLFGQMINYFTHRPDTASQILVDRWMSGDDFHTSDRKLVRIVMDSIPQGLVTVQFNSLQIRESFSGIYYPKPAVQVSYDVPTGYNIFIKEYPDSGKNFSLFADSAITLTFVMRQSVILPVEITSLNCDQGNGNTTISWTTASEFNNDYFVVEYSTDALHWSDIGIVDGAGNSNYVIQYSFSDTLHAGGYYRLRQIDFDRSSATSTIVYCDTPTTVQDKFDTSFTLFPNPATDKLHIVGIGAIESVDVVSITGQMHTKQFSNAIDVSSLLPGIYLAAIYTKNETVYKKFIKQ